MNTTALLFLLVTLLTACAAVPEEYPPRCQEVNLRPGMWCKVEGTAYSVEPNYVGR